MSIKLKLLRNVKEGDKVPPQMKVIIDTLAAVGEGKEIDRDTVVQTLEKEGKLNTRQPVQRILGYYMNRLTGEGFVELIRAPEPVKEKATKPEKTAGATSVAKPEKPEKPAAPAA